MTNYHKLFLDSNYKAPPYQPAKPFFALFNTTNYWLQAALVVAVFIILNFLPFMREASRRAGGDQCPSLFGMLKDAFMRKEEVHQICNQTPAGHNTRSAGETGDGEEECSGDEGEIERSDRRYKVVRQARYPACPAECIPINKPDTCKRVRCDDTCGGLPPPSLRCGEGAADSYCNEDDEDEEVYDTHSQNGNSTTDLIPVRAHCRQTHLSGRVPVRAHCRRLPSRQYIC